jgi:hypothetical protein
VGDPIAQNEIVTIPARVAAGDSAFPRAIGKEDPKIGDKSYSFIKYTYQTKSREEMGRYGSPTACRTVSFIGRFL